MVPHSDKVLGFIFVDVGPSHRLKSSTWGKIGNSDMICYCFMETELLSNCYILLLEILETVSYACFK